VHGVHRIVVTNTTPTTAYRGAGRPNVSYIIERLVDEAAREMGIDRLDLRRRNIIPKESYPYSTPTGSVYDSGDVSGLLEDAVNCSDWSGYPKRLAESKAQGKLRGRALCVFTEPAGTGGSPVEETAIQFTESGKALLYTVSGPSGQGHETSYPEIVAAVLGIDAHDITLRFSDPDGPVLRGDGSIGSRSLMSHGSALHNAAKVVVEKGHELAAKHLEVGAQDIDFAEGQYRVKGTDLFVGLQELAKTYVGTESTLDTQFAGAQMYSFPTGAHVAEVEVDPETGVVEIQSYVGVDDCGTVINHELAEGQVQGGIMQGLGQVLGEVCIYNDEGQLVTGSFMDYCMPRAHDIKGLSLPTIHSGPRGLVKQAQPEPCRRWQMRLSTRCVLLLSTISTCRYRHRVFGKPLKRATSDLRLRKPFLKGHCLDRVRSEACENWTDKVGART
jgi:carbon-monoxide dehydrogenase large subunit